jgi:hypothetical protein
MDSVPIFVVCTVVYAFILMLLLRGLQRSRSEGNSTDLARDHAPRPDSTYQPDANRRHRNAA